MATAQPTTNHDEIRAWVEARGGNPARVAATGSGEDPGILRIDFPGFSGEDTLEAIEWDEFFEWFDRNQLALLLSDEDGNRFNKLVSRTTAKAGGSAKRASRSSATKRGATRKTTKTSAKKSSSKSSAKKSSAKKASTKKASAKKASSTTKRSSTKKASSAKRSPAKRSVASKRPATKSTKKSAASSKKSSAKKSTKRTATSRKPSPAKKTASSKKSASSTRKSSGKKSSATKSGTKSATGRVASAVRRVIGSTKKKAASKSTSNRGGSKGGTRRSSSASVTTTNRAEIRKWVEARGGFPAHVKRTGSRKNDLGVLRIDYPGYSGRDTLERVGWDEWFDAFDRNKLAFLYQDKKNSRFSKLVAR